MEPVVDRPLDRPGAMAGTLGPEDKGLVHWALSSLMVAEERITTKFAGLVMAAESEEEATFLASQQVDEARHMQFYARFQDEVIAEPAAIAAHVARARARARTVVRGDLRPGARLRPRAARRQPAPTRSRRSSSSTTYHVVIEAPSA